MEVAQYRDMAVFAQFGADVDTVTRKLLERGDRMTELLKQPKEEIRKLSAQTALLTAFRADALSKVPVKSVRAFETALLKHLYDAHFTLMQAIDTTKELDDAAEQALQKAILAFGNTDEIFAVAASHPVVYFRYMLGLILTPMAGWVGGTFLGCAFSALLPTAIRSAFAVAIYGMFIAIIAPVARQLKSVAVVIGIAVILSVTLRICPWFSWISEGFSIILCTIIAAALGAWLFPVQEGHSHD